MIAIIDYGAGNVRSVANIIEYLGVEYCITDRVEDIEKASKILFPGQGAAKTGMENLQKKGLIDVIKNTKKPFLGICVGMQLLFDYSQEDDTTCLGIIPGKVQKFQSDSPQYKIPQIGWNQIVIQQKSPLLENIKDESYFYFVHSYACYPESTEQIVATSNYINDFCCVVQKDNFYGVQFHAEKSEEKGMQLLRNFFEKV